MYVRYKIKLLSKLRTPLYSDTIFGHFCWGIRYLKGEKYLEDFLEEFSTKKDAPLLISCAFPENHIPRPILEPVKRSFLKELAIYAASKICNLKNKSESEKLFHGLQILKKLNKNKWINIEEWLKLRSECNAKNLLLLDISKIDSENENPFLIKSGLSSIKKVVRVHNSISRVTGMVKDEGGLYFVTELWPEKDMSFDLYVYFESEQYKALWDEVWKDYIMATGFGKDKSTGSGQIIIEEDTEDINYLFELQGTNAHMSLSLLGFEKMPDLPASYSVFTRYGKLGGDFAVAGPDGGRPNPFKKPILLLEPGSVFFTEESPQGSLLQNVHLDFRIRHYGLSLWLPLSITGG